jgi:hypothetical protein
MSMSVLVEKKIVSLIIQQSLSRIQIRQIQFAVEKVEQILPKLVALC